MEQSMQVALAAANRLLWDHLLIYLLLGVGSWFTWRLRALQLRAFGHAWTLIRSAGSAQPGITSFQALATGLASRVGTGTIAGVAIALSVGGPGAVFWMWATAVVGMASAFVEATLAQLFKIDHGDRSFRGGPAYYIEAGLGSRRWGTVFALLLILTFGFVFNAVQAHSIADAFEHSWHLPPAASALGLVLLTAPVLFGGVRRIGRVAAWVVPLMALGYLAMALDVMIVHWRELPALVQLIWRNAFGLEPLAGGASGYAVAQAVSMGVKRGLFANEAGMGSAPNAAAMATTHHPVTQGLLQMIGVFVDTMLICSATAVLILLSGIVQPGMEMAGAQLTQAAMAVHFGRWADHYLAAAIFLFAWTSIVGNYAYAEGNIEYIWGAGRSLAIFRVLVLAVVAAGCLLRLPTVWSMADVCSALMALINLVAITLLGRYAALAWRDYAAQRDQRIAQPAFSRTVLPAAMAAKLPPRVW